MGSIFEDNREVNDWERWHILHDLVVASLAERVAEPLKTLVETISGSSASGLDVL